MPSKNIIKARAVSFSARPDIFKASKGWLDKFLQRCEKVLGKISFKWFFFVYTHKNMLFYLFCKFSTN